MPFPSDFLRASSCVRQGSCADASFPGSSSQAVRLSPEHIGGDDRTRRLTSLRYYWSSRRSILIATAIQSESLELVITRLLVRLVYVALRLHAPPRSSLTRALSLPAACRARATSSWCTTAA